jgi:hypothetical protein
MPQKYYFFMEVVLSYLVVAIAQCVQPTPSPYAVISAGQVFTPARTPVDVQLLTPALTTAEVVAIDQYIHCQYPNVQILSSATRDYNCHDYAWSYSLGDPPHWMDDPTPYTVDGSYYRTGTTPGAVGNRLYFYSSSHSAIVSQLAGGDALIISKWGQAGLIMSTILQCPYQNGGYISFARGTIITPTTVINRTYSGTSTESFPGSIFITGTTVLPNASATIYSGGSIFIQSTHVNLGSFFHVTPHLP